MWSWRHSCTAPRWSWRAPPPRSSPRTPPRSAVVMPEADHSEPPHPATGCVHLIPNKCHHAVAGRVCTHPTTNLCVWPYAASSLLDSWLHSSMHLHGGVSGTGYLPLEDEGGADEALYSMPLLLSLSDRSDITPLRSASHKAAQALSAQLSDSSSSLLICRRCICRRCPVPEELPSDRP